jgi:hypothetical protein
MKRINPLLTANNPAPIPGCHAPVKAIAHSAVVISLKRVYCVKKLINPTMIDKNKSALNG